MSKIFQIYCYNHPVNKQPLSVDEMLFKNQTIKKIKKIYAKNLKVVIVLDGKKVDPKDYKKTRVKEGSRVDIVPDIGWVAWLFFVAIPWIAWNLAISYGLAYLGGELFGPDIPESRGDPGTESQNFAWAPRTTNREGGPKSKFYGHNQLSGNIIFRWTDVDIDGNEILYLMLGYGEGPVEGRVSGQTFINGQPIGNFDGLSIQSRRGTFNQTCMTGFEKPGLEYSPKTEITNAGGAFTFTTPNNFIDDIGYTIAFTRGLWAYDKMGDRVTGSVRVKVEISERGLSAWTTLLQEKISGNQMRPLYKAYKASEQGYVCANDKQYDLRVTKISNDLDDGRNGNTLELRTVREFVHTAFTHPGTVLLGVTALATEKLSGSVNVTCEWEGRIVSTYNGATWDLEYSRNRAWVYLDSVTQPVISGDGDSIPYAIEMYEGIDPSKVDLAFIYEWAEWCADQVNDGDGGFEDRMPCDYIIDYLTDLWTVSYEIAQTGRMYPYWLGHILTGWCDKAVASPIDLVTVDNMKDGSWKNRWTAGQDLIGHIDVFYRDALQNFARQPVPVSNENAGLYNRTTTLEGIGVISRSLATRIGNHSLQRNQLIRNINLFTMYKDAVRWTLGDVLRIQHNVANWGKSYRVVAKVNNNTMTLDREIVANVGDALYLRTYDSSTEDVNIGTYVVDTASGTSISIVGNWTIDPVKNYIVAIGTTKLRRITKIEPTVDNYFDIEVETYDDDLFLSDSNQPANPNADYIAPAVDNQLDRPMTRWDVLKLINEMTPSSPDIEIPWLANISFAGNNVDTVYWAQNSDSGSSAPCQLRYRGTTYEITPDNTTDEFIFWDPNFTDQFRTTNIAAVAMAPDNWLFCINKDGIAYPANATQLQHAAILLAGTIRAEQYMELRQTYVYNGDDSLDNSKPFEMPFKIVSEMTLIHSLKLSFRIMPYRAYSTGASSGGADTSGSGGDETTGVDGSDSVTSAGYTSYPFTAQTTSVDPGDTSSKNLSTHYHEMPSHDHTVSGDTDSVDGTGSHYHGITSYNCDTNAVDPGNTYTANLGEHDHTMGTHYHQVNITDHTHNVDISNHSHTQPTHTHTIPNHVHGITYAIHEESNSPTVHFHVNNGSGFGDPSADYVADQLDLDITAQVTTVGWKAIRFDTDLRCRIFAILDVKLDITA